MPPAIQTVSPPDISAILTSLGVFSLAIAAVVGGIYKGLKEIKKGGADTGAAVAGALIMDRSSLTMLVDSNDRLGAVNREIVDAMRKIDHSVNLLIEAVQDQRSMTRSQIEEQHRLRAATVDLVEATRRMKS